MNRWRNFAQLALAGKGKEHGAGYTITEVLVVLAVTTVMFIFFATAFSGRQAQAEFNQSVRNLEAELQTLISEVANGVYQGGNTCSVATGYPVLSAAPVAPGSQRQCVFLGKVFVARSGGSEVLTVLGRRLAAATNLDAVNYTESNFRAMVDPIDLTEDKTLDYNLNIRRIYEMTSTGANSVNTYGAFGFLNELGAGASSTNAFSGSRSVGLHAISSTASPIPGGTTRQMLANSTIIPSSLVAMPNGIRICLLGGTDPVRDKRAEITIGENNSQTNINVLVDTGIGGICGNV